MDAPRRIPLDPAAVEEALRAAGPLTRVVVVPRTASTSADVVAGLAAGEPWPDRSLLVADHQAAGRGRRGRTWTTPPHAALTVSVVLRPDEGDVPVATWGWLPLLGGLAVVEALAEVAGLPARLKWPNDVLVGTDGDDLPGWGARRKVAGVLGDLVATPAGRAAVVGIGVNVDQRADELPVPSASSVALAAGQGVDREDLLVSLVRHLLELDARWRAGRGDAAAAGLLDRCSAACSTIGEPVRVELPGGGVLDGVARGLAADGALEVVDAVGALRTVLAGDVRHVRSAP